MRQKASYEQLSETAESAFLYRRLIRPRFDMPFHFHPELELTLILAGSGRRFVGQEVAPFAAGDLVLLGAHVPHTWLSNDIAGGNTAGDDMQGGESRAIVVQFREHFMGGGSWAMPEMAAIRALLQRAQAGVHVQGRTRDLIARKMTGGVPLPSLPKLLLLLEILQDIAISDETVPILWGAAAPISTSGVEATRFHVVYAYLVAHYREEIALGTVADIANMTPTSFCRFYKRIARKTFVDTLTEFRIQHACQLLATTEKPVADICFGSGFGNIPYFNKVFKQALGCSPLGYRKAFLQRG